MQKIMVRINLNIEDNIASVYKDLSGKMKIKLLESFLNYLNGNTPDESEVKMFKFLTQALDVNNTLVDESHVKSDAKKNEKDSLNELYTELQTAGKQFLKSED